MTGRPWEKDEADTVRTAADLEPNPADDTPQAWEVDDDQGRQR